MGGDPCQRHGLGAQTASPAGGPSPLLCERVRSLKGHPGSPISAPVSLCAVHKGPSHGPQPGLYTTTSCTRCVAVASANCWLCPGGRGTGTGPCLGRRGMGTEPCPGGRGMGAGPCPGGGGRAQDPVLAGGGSAGDPVLSLGAGLLWLPGAPLMGGWAGALGSTLQAGPHLAGLFISHNGPFCSGAAVMLVGEASETGLSSPAAGASAAFSSTCPSPGSPLGPLPSGAHTAWARHWDGLAGPGQQAPAPPWPLQTPSVR